MQQLDQLWKLISIAGQMRDFAQESRSYRFAVGSPVTFYLHVEHSHVLLATHNVPEILVDASFQAGFGWRAQAEQDAAGVYFVARRRPLLGNMSRATLHVTTPPGTYIVLRLEHCAYTVKDVTDEVHLTLPDFKNK